MAIKSTRARLVAALSVLWCTCASAQYQWSAPAAPYGGQMPSFFGAPAAPAAAAPQADPLKPWLAPAPAATAAPAGAPAAPGGTTGGWYSPWGTTQPAPSAPLPTITPGGGFTGLAPGGWYTPAPETQQPLAPNPWVQQVPSGWSGTTVTPAPASPWVSPAPAVSLPQSGWQQMPPTDAAAPAAPSMLWNTAPTLPQTTAGPLGPADGLLPNPWMSAAPAISVSPNPWVSTGGPAPAVPQDTTLGPSWTQPATTGWQYMPGAPGQLGSQATAPNPWLTTPFGQGATTAPAVTPNAWLLPGAATNQPPAGAWWQQNTVPTTPGLYGMPAPPDANATNPTP